MTEEQIERPNEANGGLNVLVVDDSSVARAMIIKTLRMAELPLSEIREAANGQDALAAIEEHWIDLVLADINMPVMGGDEMIDRIRDNPGWADLAVIVISTDGNRPRIEKLVHQGVMFLRKPFTPETLSDVVTELLEISYVQ
ncbi:hypothetical protein LCGC14_1764190 [marine sediment metagenome]|uniref:Response regulatory domain-containing protein n=1 Tax=marine sediment metagenome TaxID=412755 RepID=A0A0F9H058_9ZZZZ